MTDQPSGDVPDAAGPSVAGLPVRVTGLTVRGPYGVIFDGVTGTVGPGGVLVVHGPARCGRTTLLLALAGRHRITAGTVDVGPYRVPGQAGAVRRVVTVAQAEPAVGFDERLRVGEILEEHRAVARLRRAELDAALADFGLDLPAREAVDELEPHVRTRFAIALASARRPVVLVVDDVDRGCPPEQRHAVWDAVARMAASGCTVLAGVVDPPPFAAAAIALPHRTDALAQPRQEDVQP